MSVAKSVRLAELDYDPVVLAMAGQEARLEKVDDLVASISAEGLLQSLKVRTDPDASRYLVTAGLRRLTALKWLRDHGGTIVGQAVTDDTNVAVIYSEETDDAARRQAVAENVQRVALTVGAEVRQFAELAKTESPAAIAARFGVTEKRVQQRLKLAGLHADVLQALDDGKISIKAAEAFTVEEDPDKQAKYLKKSGGNSYNLDPQRIREAFTKKLVRSDSAIALHIGADDYAAAGGLTMEDPFSDAVYWISDDIIERLAADRTAALVEGWKSEGWSFVETSAEFGGDWWTIHYGRKVHGEPVEGGGTHFTAEQKALSGVVYYPDVSHGPQFGVVKKDTVLPDEKPVAPPAPNFWMPGGNVSNTLMLALGEAASRKVEGDPSLALRLIVLQLAVTAVQRNNAWATLLHIDATDVREGSEIGTELPGKIDELVEWVRGLGDLMLMEQLARLMSLTIRVRGSLGETAMRQLALIDPDTLAVFDAEAYFGAIEKPLIALAYQDITGKTLKDGKLETMAGKTIVEARAQGWLPPQLRTASYAGPCHVTPPAAAEDDPQDDGLDPDDDDGLGEDDDAQREAAE